MTVAATNAPAFRYVSRRRLLEILVLQGSPLVGAILAIGRPSLLHVAPLVLLAAGNLCLVGHIFLLNDWSNITSDSSDPNKAATVFTARGVNRREIASVAVGLLVVGLLLLGSLGARVFVLAAAIATLSALYSLPSFDWKGTPLLNSVAHLVGGALHFLLGYAVMGVDRRGVLAATFFAVTFTAGHLTQEVRDYDGDILNHIRTNAVMFGRRRAFAASLVLFTVAYGLLVWLAVDGVVPRLAGVVAVILYPLHLYWSRQTLRQLTYVDIGRFQSRYRAIYAAVGAAIAMAPWLP